jgi:hypothetical protein
VEDAGGAVLVAAMEEAPAAIYCLGGPAMEPVWANARARELGATRADLPSVAGRRVADLADAVARTGRPETLHGALGSDGQTASVVLQPLTVGGGPGVLLVLEHAQAPGPALERPATEADVVELACGPRAATGTTPSRSGAAASRWWSGTPSATGSRPPGR